MSSLSDLFKTRLVDTLPRLMRGWQSDAPADATRDEKLLMMTGRFRDVHSARKAMRKAGVRTAAAMLPHLPAPYRPNWRRRLWLWLISFQGAYPHNPHGQMLREWHTQARRQKRRIKSL